MEAHATLLSSAAHTLLSEFYAYKDLAEHLRAIPEAAEALGLPADAEHTIVLTGLEQRLAAARRALASQGLYPGLTTTTVDVLLNGEPIALPAFCRESPMNEPSPDGPTATEVPMEAIHEHHPTRTQMNGPDLPVESDPDAPRLLDAIRPYLPFVATFTVGVVVGALGASYLGATDPITA